MFVIALLTLQDGRSTLSETTIITNVTADCEIQVSTVDVLPFFIETGGRSSSMRISHISSRARAQTRTSLGPQEVLREPWLGLSKVWENWRRNIVDVGSEEVASHTGPTILTKVTTPLPCTIEYV